MKYLLPNRVVLLLPAQTTCDPSSPQNFSIEADMSLETLMGGTALRDAQRDGYSCTIRCCSPGGDLFNVTFSRDGVSITSYNDDSILTTIETWADTKTILN